MIDSQMSGSVRQPQDRQRRGGSDVNLNSEVNVALSCIFSLDNES